MRRGGWTFLRGAGLSLVAFGGFGTDGIVGRAEAVHLAGVPRRRWCKGGAPGRRTGRGTWHRGATAGGPRRPTGAPARAGRGPAALRPAPRRHPWSARSAPPPARTPPARPARSPGTAACTSRQRQGSTSSAPRSPGSWPQPAGPCRRQRAGSGASSATAQHRSQVQRTGRARPPASTTGASHGSSSLPTSSRSATSPECRTFTDSTAPSGRSWGTATYSLPVGRYSGTACSSSGTVSSRFKRDLPLASAPGAGKCGGSSGHTASD